jgi:photosystem II stability/assembly factor-like uncharacterized protein
MKGIEGGPVSVLTASGTNIFAGSEDGVFLSNNKGESWTSVSSGLPTNIGSHIMSMATSTDDSGRTYLFAGCYYGLFRSINNGSNWNRVANGWPEYSAIYALAVNGSNIFAGIRFPSNAFTSGVYCSKDYGQTWASANSGLPQQSQGTPLIIAVCPDGIGGKNLFVNIFDSLYRSHCDSIYWTRVDSGLPASLTAECYTISVDETGDTLLFLGTFDHGVFRSNDYGVSWTTADSGLTSLEVIRLAVGHSGSGGTNIFANTWEDGMFLSTNYGMNWKKIGSDLCTPAASLLSTSNEAGGTNLYASTSQTGIFLSSDNGTSWSTVNTGLTLGKVSSFVSCSTAAGARNLFASSMYNGILRSIDDGGTWSKLSLGIVCPIIDCMLASPQGNGENNLFVGTWGKGLLRSQDYGGHWTNVGSGLVNDTILSLAMSPNGKTIFAGTYKGLFLSTDNGDNWQSIDSELTNRDITSLAAVANDTGGIKIFAGTSGIGILCSTDNGINWFRADSTLWDTVAGFPPNFGITALSVISNGEAKMDLFAGGYFSSGPNYGKHIFKSADSGRSWTVTSTGLPPNTTVLSFFADLYQDTVTAVFAITNSGTYFSIDGGRNWGAYFDSSLVNLNISALVVSGTNLLAAATNNQNAGSIWKQPLSTISTRTNPNRGLLSKSEQPLSIVQNIRQGITTIKFSVSQPSDISIVIYSLLGKKIVNLFTGNKNAGANTVIWNTKKQSPGIYIVCLKSGNKIVSRVVTLSK